jgi:hypothetical protein
VVVSRRVNSIVGPLQSRDIMRRVLYSLVGGVLIMVAAGVCFLLSGANQFFKWVMAWPALFLYRFFPPPAPDQIFPRLGSDTGILCTFAVATLAYSLLVYVVLWLYSKTSRPT